VLGVGEGDLGTVPISYPKKIAQVLERGTTGTFHHLNAEITPLRPTGIGERYIKII
jgi:hypothetical protein